MLKYVNCHLFRCLWTMEGVSPLATAFLRLRKLMKFLKVVFIFILLTRFPNSNKLRPRVYHPIYAVQMI